MKKSMMERGGDETIWRSEGLAFQNRSFSGRFPVCDQTDFPAGQNDRRQFHNIQQPMTTACGDAFATGSDWQMETHGTGKADRQVRPTVGLTEVHFTFSLPTYSWRRLELVFPNCRSARALAKFILMFLNLLFTKFFLR